MTSPFANLFLSLQEQIAALADNDGNPYFRHIDQDLGQLENHNGDCNAPVSWPCVLIDIDSFSFTELGENVQQGQGNIKLRIGFKAISNTTSRTPVLYKEKALNYYDLEQVLYNALQGANPGDMDGYEGLQNIFGSYTRTSSFTEQREDFIRVRVLTFSLALEDSSAAYAQTFAPASIDLTSSFG